ncbi:MAG: acyl-CoA/acyl-ACP dehydrogenase [Kangiellaceae bacterium]|nr:acyl-CoA/acyl-ACP dehydrogenase [Kangiellaceae bacterium]
MDATHKIGKETLSKYAMDVDKKARFPNESLTALKSLLLLSAYVPKEYGGLGLNIEQISKLCEIMARYCASTAMIYSMHQIQVACIVHHSLGSSYYQNYVRLLVKEQRLIASATTEIGTGGDLLASFCAVEAKDGKFKISKKAPVISYGEAADDLILTARKDAEAPQSDQVHILLNKEQYNLTPISGWDTLGFRGTCSSGFDIVAEGTVDQICPIPFPEVLSQSMHPFAHITWAALWSGICIDAVNNARIYVRKAVKNNPNVPPISSIRLAEVDKKLYGMRNNIQSAIADYTRLLDAGDSNAFTNFGFAIKINNLKIQSSELLIEIVGKAMMICGIGSYRNDSPASLCRHIRDAYGASLMVNNDRIMMHNATLVQMHKEGL